MNPLTLLRKVQFNGYSCGPTSVWMVIANLVDPDISYREVFETIGTTKEGSTVKGLLRALRANGVACTVYQNLTITRLRTKLGNDNDRMAIVHVDGDHFMVVNKISKARVYVADPSIGRFIGTSTSHEKFRERWEGWAIVCS